MFKFFGQLSAILDTEEMYLQLQWLATELYSMEGAVESNLDKIAIETNGFRRKLGVSAVTTMHRRVNTPNLSIFFCV